MDAGLADIHDGAGGQGAELRAHGGVPCRRPGHQIDGWAPPGVTGTEDVFGPKTEQAYIDCIKKAKTVFWNGPMGVFEIDQFAHGTKVIAEAIADNAECTSIIGGGDSVSAINKFGPADKMSWISTGGGASMELVEGKALPGVEALLDA